MDLKRFVAFPDVQKKASGKKKRAQVAYPKHFYLARGNHETKSMNKLYGFQGEVRRGVYLSSSKANTD